MLTNLRKILYRIRQQTEGIAGIGLLIFMVTLLVLVILPISIGLLEFQFFNIEKEQVKTATESTVNIIYESVGTQPLSKVSVIPDISEFEAELTGNLSALHCSVVPEDLSVEFVEDQWLLVTYNYKHQFKSFDFQKPMSVFLKYWLPCDQ